MKTNLGKEKIHFVTNDTSKRNKNISSVSPDCHLPKFSVISEESPGATARKRANVEFPLCVIEKILPNGRTAGRGIKIAVSRTTHP